MIWIFTIPNILPSRNATHRRHWAVLGKYKTSCAWSLTAAKREHGIPDATGKRKVTITRLIGKGGRLMDERNIDDKRMTDAMVLVGLLVDDAPQWVDITVKQERAADGEPGTRIELEDLP